MYLNLRKIEAKVKVRLKKRRNHCELDTQFIDYTRTVTT